MPVDIADAPFDPSNLERAIVALPLLQMMEEDLEAIGKVKEYRPDLLEKYNAAIEYVVQPPAKSRKKSKPNGEVRRAAYEEIKTMVRIWGQS